MMSKKRFFFCEKCGEIRNTIFAANLMKDEKGTDSFFSGCAQGGF